MRVHAGVGRAEVGGAHFRRRGDETVGKTGMVCVGDDGHGLLVLLQRVV